MQLGAVLAVVGVVVGVEDVRVTVMVMVAGYISNLLLMKRGAVVPTWRWRAGANNDICCR